MARVTMSSGDEGGWWSPRHKTWENEIPGGQMPDNQVKASAALPRSGRGFFSTRKRDLKQSRRRISKNGGLPFKAV
jgi:hypothetical protein